MTRFPISVVNNGAFLPPTINVSHDVAVAGTMVSVTGVKGELYMASLLTLNSKSGGWKFVVPLNQTVPDSEGDIRMGVPAFSFMMPAGAVTITIT